MRFPDEEAQYEFREFGKFQFIYFSSLNFKDLFKYSYASSLAYTSSMGTVTTDIVLAANKVIKF